ncbi:MAG: hypothetical protein OEX04_02550 [Acidimicrobiia bacterium]|nr:hypothetical protein [Acidimicrobiia bacterium]MDH4306334.1 hypothetical protein [Acidimicrobiia bacterium]MDH5294496.1 hypothetical protein [Acidimicrobiia bacterium]
MTDQHESMVHGDMEEEFGLGARIGKSVVRGIVLALPISFVGLVLGLWLLTDRDLGLSMETAILPAALIGVFFGGFFGVALTLLDIERQEKAMKRSRRSNR